MPTYVYACKSCAHQFEKYQSFSEQSLVQCPDCREHSLRKVFNSVGIVFKGSGFYSTDSSTSARSSGASSSGSSEAAGSDSGASDVSSSSSSSSESTSVPAAS